MSIDSGVGPPARPGTVETGGDGWDTAAPPRLTPRRFALHGGTTGSLALPDHLATARLAGFDAVEIADDDRIEGFDESLKLPHWVNAGVYVLGDEAIERLPEGSYTVLSGGPLSQWAPARTRFEVRPGTVNRLALDVAPNPLVRFAFEDDPKAVVVWLVTATEERHLDEHALQPVERGQRVDRARRSQLLSAPGVAGRSGGFRERVRDGCGPRRRLRKRRASGRRSHAAVTRVPVSGRAG